MGVGEGRPPPSLTYLQSHSLNSNPACMQVIHFSGNRVTIVTSYMSAISDLTSWILEMLQKRHTTVCPKLRALSNS